VVGDRAWELIEPLLPTRERRTRNPGRRPLDDRAVLTGILVVLAREIGFERLPVELGCGSGMTCWRRLRDWQRAEVWPRIVEILLDELPEARRLDFTRVAGTPGYVAAPPNAVPRKRPSPVAETLGFTRLPRVRGGR
jgi:transposase